MNIVTSATVFRDSLGMRLSYTYSILDEHGHVISDNNRGSKVITESAIVEKASDILTYAQQSVEE